MKSIKNRVNKKKKNLDDYYKDCDVNIENNCSNMTNILNEGMPSSDSAVIYNIPSIKIKKLTKGKCSDNYEIVRNFEYEQKKKHKKHMGNTENNISNDDLNAKCAVDKEDSFNQNNTMLISSHSDNPHDSKRSKKKYAVKDEPRMNIIEEEVNTSNFTSEFIIKSEHETDSECNRSVENAFVNGHTIHKKINHKYEDMRTNSKSENETDKDYDKNFDIVSLSTSKKRKKCSDKGTRKKSKPDCNNINTCSENDVKFEDESSIDITPKKRKKSKDKNKISKKHQICDNISLEGIESGDENHVDGKETSISSCELNSKDKLVKIKKSPKTAFIHDSILNMLNTRLDEMVENDKKKHKCKESDKEMKTLNDGIDIKDDHNRKQKIRDKRKIIELLKHTKSMEQIKDEMDIKDDDDAEELHKMNITMPFSLPPVHKIASNVSYHASDIQKKKLEAAGIKLKVGKYTKDEDEKILQNWKSFCKYNNWDEKKYHPFVRGSTNSKFGILPKAEFRKFVEFLSHNFEDRLMYNIYHRFQRIFMQNDIDYDSFTPEDDKVIMEYVDSRTGDKPFADLAVLLKRPRLALLKRYSRLQTEKLFGNDRVNWDEDLSRKLIRNILKVTKSRKLSELKDRHITTKEWEKISKKMRIPLDKIKRVWKIDFYARLINPLYDEQYGYIKCRIVEILSKEYTSRREIDWSDVAKQFGETFSSNRLYKMFNDMSKKVPKKQRKDLKECLEYLKDKKFRKVSPKYGFINKIFEEMENETDSYGTQSTK